MMQRIIQYRVEERKNPIKFVYNIPSDEFTQDKLEINGDLFTIASAIFELENKLKEFKVKEIKIPISKKTAEEIDSDKVSVILSEIVNFLIKKIVKINIHSQPVRGKGTITYQEKECSNNICLFSGGIDSYSGILNTKKELGSVLGIFIRHPDFTNLKVVFEKLYNLVLRPNEIPLRYLRAPPHGINIHQTRGFLYLAFAAVFANVFDSKNIIISECGPTMYQPRFLPLDNVTLTTNPILLKYTKDFLKAFNINIEKIIIPNENLTKAEVIASSPFKEFIKYTNSCTTSRLASSEVSHDGKCYGCVARKLSCALCNVEDAKYAYDVFSMNIGNKINVFGKNRIINSSHCENAFSLIRFAADILTDFDKLPPYTKENIISFGKEDLFRRFALDVIAALYILFEKNKQSKNNIIKTMYENIRRTISREQLTNRIDEIIECKIKPDFNNFI
jgi:hypothetical protein